MHSAHLQPKSLRFETIDINITLVVGKDVVEAYKWFNLAAAQGNTNAVNNREVVRRQLTPEQINEGQNRALKFKPAAAQ